MSYLDYVQSRESGGDPYAKNPRSSALGPFQFIDSTWNDLMTRRPDLGLTADGRTDPVQARRAADAFTQENEGILRKAGYEPDDNMRYLAHRFGAQGALSLLGASPDTPVSSVVGQGVLTANPDLAGKSVGALTRAQAFSGEQASPYAATEGQQAISSAMRQPTPGGVFMPAPDSSGKRGNDYDFAGRLGGAAASLMAITNPKGAAAMTEPRRLSGRGCERVPVAQEGRASRRYAEYRGHPCHGSRQGAREPYGA
jgi:hypothetical protein